MPTAAEAEVRETLLQVQQDRTSRSTMSKYKARGESHYGCDTGARAQADSSRLCSWNCSCAAAAYATEADTGEFHQETGPEAYQWEQVPAVSH